MENAMVIFFLSFEASAVLYAKYPHKKSAEGGLLAKTASKKIRHSIDRAFVELP